MVNFMKEHSDLAKGQIKGLAAKQTSHNLWRRLEAELNSCGPPSHNFVEWKKIWADYKSNAKAKLRRNKESMSGAGGGSSRLSILTPLEEEVVALLSIDEAINGEAQTVRFGADIPSYSNVNIDTNDAENQPPNSVSPNILLNNLPRMITSNTLQPPARARSVPPGKDSLLKLQVENQCAYHENSLQKLDEICNNLSSLNNYFKRNLEIEETKLKLEREKFAFLKKVRKRKGNCN